MCEALSGNHNSVDQQLVDVLAAMANGVVSYTGGASWKVEEVFPELANIQWTQYGTWFDTEAMGVDEEYSSWVIDWIESWTNVSWVEGEPYQLCDKECVVQ